MKKKYTIIALTLLLSVTHFWVKAQAENANAIASNENKVAVLPIIYISEGNSERVEDMRYRLQNIAYLYLKSESMELKFQSPAETNALLLKHGVNESNFREFTPKELATILGVEYILTGMVTQDITGESGINTSYRRGNGDWNRNRQVKIEQSRTRQELNTHIDLDIYNDKGEQIFSKSRRSILTDVDAYKNGIQYLLKRSPLYKR